jgi:type IV pilus assembly protein PilQ
MPELTKRCHQGLMRLKARLSGVWAAGMAGLLLALPGWTATIQSVEFTSLPGDRIEIRLQFDAPPPEPTGYTIEQPARIVLDMLGVDNTLAEKHHDLGIGNARRLSVLSTADRTRAIVNLNRLTGYETEVRGNTLFLRVGSSPAGFAESAPVVTPAAASALFDVQGEAVVTSVDFRRGTQGEGRVIVGLSDPKAPVDVARDGGRIRVEIRNTRLPSALQRRLDVTDFATPVQLVDVLQRGADTVLTLAAAGDYDYLAYQADGTLSIDVSPLTQEEITRREDMFRYTGEKLSLNFQDIEVRAVLQLIADFTDLNLVASDTVAGRITLRLRNVPWDQALDLILRTRGLDKRQIGNVLLVAPAAEIAAREKQELENQKQISELAPLRTEFIQIRYASANQLYQLFSQAGRGGMGAAGSAGRNAMLSDRGSVIVDERTNAIIITDTTDRIEDFRRVIAQLDIAVRQVLIEARIVTASATQSEQLGIRWGGGSTLRNNDQIQIGGSLGTIQEMRGGALAGTSPGNLAVDLGALGNATRFAIGITGESYLLDLELSALATEGHAEVVARPKVITADKATAVIRSGVEIPYQEASSSGATSTSFKDAVLSLSVTPQITPDDRIIMKLNVTQDTVGQVFDGVPSINTNAIETQVLVDNAQTVVLGGIFQNDRNRSVQKTPFLGDIPYVGRAFRREIERDDKQELLIFITPRIVQDTFSR